MTAQPNQPIEVTAQHLKCAEEVIQWHHAHNDFLTANVVAEIIAKHFIAKPSPETETPRTDHAAWKVGGNMYEYCVADFARTLERELSAANARIAELMALVSATHAAIAQQQKDTPCP